MLTRPRLELNQCTALEMRFSCLALYRFLLRTLRILGVFAVKLEPQSSRRKAAKGAKKNYVFLVGVGVEDASPGAAGAYFEAHLAWIWLA